MDDDVARRALVWRYGARKGADIPVEVERQLQLAHELRERLVELALEREQAVANLWAQQPQVAAAGRRREQARRRVDELVAKAAEERATNFRSPLVSALRDQIREARTLHKRSKGVERQVKNDAYAALAPSFHALHEHERAGRRAAYAEYVQNRGLYWATYNAIDRKHAIAARAVSAERRHGRPALFRLHEYDGSGRIAVQVQRKPGRPARTAELLCLPDSPHRSVLALPAVVAFPSDRWQSLSRADRRHLGRAVVALRIGTYTDGTPNMWAIPVQIHRPVPEDAEITSAEVVITRLAAQPRISVNLTLTMPAPRPAGGNGIALDLGWRSMPDWSIRVAYWRATGKPRAPLNVPAHLAAVLRTAPGGREGEIRIPASWRTLDARVRQLRSGRLRDLRRIATVIATWLEQNPDSAAALQLSAAEVLSWRSPRQMAQLAQRIDSRRDCGLLAAQVQRWARADRRLWQWEANERDQLLSRRRDAWRAAAATLVRAWPHAIVEERFVHRTTRRPTRELPDPPQARQARAQARLSAPGELVTAIEHAVQRQGGTISYVNPALTTRRHHVCGEQLPGQIATAPHHLIHCPHCDLVFDQDQNAVMNMIEGHKTG